MRQPRQEAATHEAPVAVGASQQAHEFHLDAVDERALNGAVNRWLSSRILAITRTTAAIVLHDASLPP